MSQYCKHLAALFSLLSFPAFAGGVFDQVVQGGENSPTAQFAPQVTLPIILILKELVEVQEDRIVLSDVADCQGTRMICDEMYGVDLGKSPELGKSLKLKREVIAELAKSEWPNSQIEVRGSAVVKVSSLVMEVTGRDIEIALQRALEREFGDQSGFRILVEVAHLNRNLRIAGSNNYFVFPEVNSLDTKTAQSAVKKYAGTRRIEVQIFSGQSKEMQLSTKISFTLQVEMLAPVSEEDLPKGSSISFSKFSDKWIAVAREQDLPIAKINAFNGLKLNRRVLAGDPVRESYLDVPLAIKRGQIVNVRLSNGAVDITSKAKATKDGAIGETIEVVLVGTQKHTAARILTKNELLIQ